MKTWTISIAGGLIIIGGSLFGISAAQLSLFISDLEAAQQQCLQDTGYYCQATYSDRGYTVTLYPEENMEGVRQYRAVIQDGDGNTRIIQTVTGRDDIKNCTWSDLSTTTKICTL
jgi:hypothetical protein